MVQFQSMLICASSVRFACRGRGLTLQPPPMSMPEVAAAAVSWLPWSMLAVLAVRRGGAEQGRLFGSRVPEAHLQRRQGSWDGANPCKRPQETRLGWCRGPQWALVAGWMVGKGDPERMR